MEDRNTKEMLVLKDNDRTPTECAKERITKTKNICGRHYEVHLADKTVTLWGTTKP